MVGYSPAKRGLWEAAANTDIAKEGPEDPKKKIFQRERGRDLYGGNVPTFN